MATQLNDEAAFRIKGPVEQYLTGQSPLNTSGLIPMDLRVLVKRDAVEAKVGSLILPDQVRDQKKFTMQRATVIAIGENAWEEAASRSATFQKPAPGDRVLINKFGGVDLTGDDGETYTLMNDDDIIGRVAS